MDGFFVSWYEYMPDLMFCYISLLLPLVFWVHTSISKNSNEIFSKLCFGKIDFYTYNSSITKYILSKCKHTMNSLNTTKTWTPTLKWLFIIRIRAIWPSFRNFYISYVFGNHTHKFIIYSGKQRMWVLLEAVEEAR